MAGTRTAPTYTAQPPFRRVTIHTVDASGDNGADSYYIDPLATDVEVEALVAAYQAATQASVWKISNSGEYIGDEDPDNATALQRSSIKDGINMLFKNTASLDTFTPRIVAPDPSTMQGNQDIPMLTGTPLEGFATAMLAVQPATVGLASMQFTERVERRNNPRVKV